MNAETDIIDSKSVEQITTTEEQEEEEKEEKEVYLNTSPNNNINTESASDSSNDDENVNAVNNKFDNATDLSSATKVEEINDTVDVARTVDDDMQKELEEINVISGSSNSNNNEKTINNIADKFLHEEQYDEMQMKVEDGTAISEGNEEVQQKEAETNVGSTDSSVENSNSSTVYDNNVIDTFSDNENIVVNADDDNINNISNLGENVSDSNVDNSDNTNEFVSEWKSENDDELGEREEY